MRAVIQDSEVEVVVIKQRLAVSHLPTLPTRGQNTDIMTIPDTPYMKARTLALVAVEVAIKPHRLLIALLLLQLTPPHTNIVTTTPMATLFMTKATPALAAEAEATKLHPVPPTPLPLHP